VEEEGKSKEEGADRSGGTGSPMPSWMFETRTDAWHRAGLGHEIEGPDGRRPWSRLIAFAALVVFVLVVFGNRQALFPGLLPKYETEIQIITAILLFAFGWGFAAAFGRTVTPAVLRRMDPGTAGTVAFAIRIVTILVIAGVALAIAGVKPQTLLLGGAFTAVIFGLAAQQTLGNIFAGVVIQGARPFRVGERVRLAGGQLSGPVEGTVSSLGLFYTYFASGNERVMIPNSVILGLTVVPMEEPEGIDVRARFDSRVSPDRVQARLGEAITVPLVREPSIWLEEIDRDEVVVRIQATPVDPADGAKLAGEVLSVTRDTAELKSPDQ
jgi:small-conductance mechanosensitive channel